MPVLVATDVVCVETLEFNTFFIKSDGTLWAHGRNSYGELGDGASSNQSTPILIASDVLSVAQGGNSFYGPYVLFIKSDSTLWMMGASFFPGQFGDGSMRQRPELVTIDVKSVSAGGEHSAILKTDGSLWTVGANYYGQLGDGTLTRRTSPTLIATGVASVSAGGLVTFFVKNDGTLWAAGPYDVENTLDFYYGSLEPNPNLRMVASDVLSVSARDPYFFIKTDGRLFGMGHNWRGKLGDGTTTFRSTPVLITGSVLTNSRRATVASVTPNPAPLQNAKQLVTITGSGFEPDCGVTLRDHRAGIVYPNRTKISQTGDTEIVLNPNFGAIPAQWSVEVINPDGQSSGVHRFQVGQPVVPGDTIQSFQIVAADAASSAVGTGDFKLATTSASASSLPSRVFRAIATFFDGSIADLTNSSSWRVTGDSRASVDHGTVSLGPGAYATSLNLSASFQGSDGGLYATREVTVVPPFVVGISSEIGEFIQTNVTFYATSPGVSGSAVSHAWTRDGVVQFGSSDSINLNLTTGREYLIGVTAADRDGREDSDYIYFSLNRTALLEPTTSLAVNPKEGSLLDSNESVALFNSTAKKARGVAVIIHGLTDTAFTQIPNELAWPARMAKAIEARLSGSVPYVVMYDWSNMANPNRFRGGDRGFGILPDTVGGYLDNILSIRAYGLAQGKVLADLLIDAAEEGQLDRTKPVHLIGHSAGGFVAGECGLGLKRAGFSKVQVTMLDTPAADEKPFRSRGSGFRLERYIACQFSGAPPNYPPTLYRTIGANKLEVWNRDFESYRRDISNSSGNSTPAFAQYSLDLKLAPDSFYHRYVIDIGSSNFLEQHSYAHEWYTASIGESKPQEAGGFDYSLFLRDADFPGAVVGQSLKTAFADGEGSVSLSLAAPLTPLMGFMTFGQVTESGEIFTLTEESNSGVFLDTTLPAEVESLLITYKWRNIGDGDFLSVHWNDEPPLAVIPAVRAEAHTEIEFEVPLASYAGQTGRLTVKLISRNERNAEVELSGLMFQTSDDADGDGLSAAEEEAHGTDPQKPDSDGDELPDNVEILTTLTDPLSPDTDGDGSSDYDELMAETDPRSAASVLRITSFSRVTPNRTEVRWSSVPGKSYRVLRGDSPRGGTYRVIGRELAATGGEMIFSDDTSDAAERGFYWVELEPF